MTHEEKKAQKKLTLALWSMLDHLNDNLDSGDPCQNPRYDNIAFFTKAVLRLARAQMFLSVGDFAGKCRGNVGVEYSAEDDDV